MPHVERLECITVRWDGDNAGDNGLYNGLIPAREREEGGEHLWRVLCVCVCERDRERGEKDVICGRGGVS